MVSTSWKLTLSYDGSGFHGSQRQSARRTVQEELEHSLEVLSGHHLPTVFAGRTDRGVHAIGQVAGCPEFRSGIRDEALRTAINAHVGVDMSVVRVERVQAFHARYDATWREYRYRIWVGARQPLVSNLVWQRRSDLDLEAMAAGAQLLLGVQDVASFASGGEGVPWSERAASPQGTVRTIMHCTVERVIPWWGTAAGDRGSALEVRVVADGFLPRMVRSIVGALVEIGSGTRPPEWITQLLRERDRRLGPSTAPPHGLVLWRVGYGHDVPDPDPDGRQVLGASVAPQVTG
jgi:tRNA pseudouridine38-40 synthase